MSRIFLIIIFTMLYAAQAIAQTSNLPPNTSPTELAKTIDKKLEPSNRANASASKMPQEIVRDLASDHFAAGRDIRVNEPVVGDLIASGGNVDVAAPVGGDALLFGGNLRIDAGVAQSLYGAGGQLHINSTVGRNVRMAGGQIEIAPSANIAGNVSLAGGEININGNIKGYLQVAGGHVFINAPIGGDVMVTAGNIELGPNARVGGKLSYKSREDIKQDAAATVQGGITRMAVDGGWPVPAKMEHRMGRGGSWIWTIGLMILAAALVAMAPGFYGRVAESISTRFGMSLLIGFIALVCVPVAAILFLITIIGVPIGLLTLVLYPVMLLLGYVSFSIALGGWALQRFQPAHGDQPWWRIGAAVLTVFVVALVGRIPWVGGIAVLLALLVGIGALFLQVKRTAAPA